MAKVKKQEEPKADNPSAGLGVEDAEGKPQGSAQYKRNPENYYFVYCRYKKNRLRQSVDDKGNLIYINVDADDSKRLRPFVVHRYHIEMGKRRLWGVNWIQKMNLKLLEAKKDNMMMIIRLVKCSEATGEKDGISEGIEAAAINEA